MTKKAEVHNGEFVALVRELISGGAKQVVRLGEALIRKIEAPQTTANVAKQCVKHGRKLLANTKFVTSWKACESVAEFLDKAQNIKALDYIAVMAQGRLNDYLAIALDGIEGAEAPTTQAVYKALEKFYGESTCRAQTSMTVAALRAMQVIVATSAPHSPIEAGPNWSQALDLRKAHSLKRRPTAA